MRDMQSTWRPKKSADEPATVNSLQEEVAEANPTQCAMCRSKGAIFHPPTGKMLCWVCNSAYRIFEIHNVQHQPSPAFPSTTTGSIGRDFTSQTPQTGLTPAMAYTLPAAAHSAPLGDVSVLPGFRVFSYTTQAAVPGPTTSTLATEPPPLATASHAPVAALQASVAAAPTSPTALLTPLIGDAHFEAAPPAPAAATSSMLSGHGSDVATIPGTRRTSPAFASEVRASVTCAASSALQLIWHG